ncbi:MAG: hypothetical protein ABWY82_13090 [Tardiphaga sp.]|jgi:hypothetical protein
MVVHVTARQLHLFRGKCRRGIAPPAPTEFASQAFLVDLIKRTIDPWFTHMPAGECPHRHTHTNEKKPRTTPGLSAAELAEISTWGRSSNAWAGGAARRGYSRALLLPLVAPSQPLAELLGAVAFLRPPDQRAH